MSKKMLIDAGHREETRVAMISNGKVEDFDFESLSKKPLRGNIYLARVTRVEPSLQAAFVEYGGNRHGFLAFSEIHSDYYQIPVSDRDILRKAEELEAELAAELGNEEDNVDEDEAEASAAQDTSDSSEDGTEDEQEDIPTDEADDTTLSAEEEDIAPEDEGEAIAAESEDTAEALDEVASVDNGDDREDEDGDEEDAANERAALMADVADEEISLDVSEDDEEESQEPREQSLEERYRQARRERVKLLRNYRIQEVIKRRQILLIQVVKEERGNKGAALTTYLSLAGRYCVLMPNTSRGGGISRKISNGSDRRRLRKAMNELEIPQGIGLIIRTAGSKRTKAEIKRDYDYLLRLWENIRDLTMKSIAPCLIYEEASLIKRAIRDLYDKDISQVLVEGEAGYREAKDFMKMLMPSHAKNVQPYKEKVPLFLKHKVEQQLDEMYQPVVKLKSGGYLVIQQTEALISIDVNSGRATKERNIEATALKTNLESAAEVARQCRLRDLAGLVVVDFIDMEENRNNRAVERKLKDAMKTDRARIQLGRISNFGLLELSRQRRRSGIVDGTTSLCPTCSGAGAVRSHEMAALRILRSIEEAALQGRAGIIAASTSTDVALYILNNKRDWLARIEDTYALSIEINADATKAGDQYEIEKRGPAREQDRAQAVVTADLAEIDADAADNAETSVETSEDEEEKPARKRRRRRRRKGSSDEASSEQQDGQQADEDQDAENSAEQKADGTEATSEDEEDGGKRRRRRGRRGGRRNRKRSEDSETEATDAQGESSSDTNEPVAEEASAEEQPAQNAEAEAADATKLEKAAANDSSSQEEALAEPVAEPVAEPAAEAETDIDAEEAPVKPEPPKDTKSSGPKRGGWWQRALGR